MNRSCGVISSLVVFGLLAVGAREGVSQTVVQGKPVGPFDAYVAPDAGSHADSAQRTYLIVTNLPGCPIDFHAQRGPNGGMVVIRDFGELGPTMIFGQRLHMTLTNPQAKDIVGVTMLVHGLTDRTRMTPTMHTASRDGGTISRTVQLGVNVGSWKQVATDLTVDSFAAVTRIDLLEVAYQDGSTWHASETQSCRITPDLYMPVVMARVP